MQVGLVRLPPSESDTVQSMNSFRGLVAVTLYETLNLVDVVMTQPTIPTRPCLSNAEYTAVTLDGSLATRVEISGGRTDDLVRVFMEVQIDVLQVMS